MLYLSNVSHYGRLTINTVSLYLSYTYNVRLFDACNSSCICRRPSVLSLFYSISHIYALSLYYIYYNYLLIMLSTNHNVLLQYWLE